ncbi:hypothetical protein C8R44DRAFT_895723 [Mycena epipterygia]|nr:hypothetical protein C8R44DRAFT_895723 [Mycena epipterygia]
MGDTADNYKIPASLNDHFRHAFDPADNFMAAFEHELAFSAILGDDHWGGVRWRPPPKRKEFDDYSFGHDEGVKEGHTSGLHDGKKEGRKAGKAQGLKEGDWREFGEKQTAKLSKPLASESILVDAGTDSPLTELLLPLAPSTVTYASAFEQTDAQCDTILPILSTTPSLIWADEPSDLHIPKRTNSPQLPPCDLSTLRSNLTSSAPFATLRYCAPCTQKSPGGTHRSAMPACYAWIRIEAIDRQHRFLPRLGP